MCTTFDHVTIICADLEATRRFYVDVLGMTEVPRPAFRFPGLWFQTGNVQIHATQESPEAGRAGWADQGGKVVSRGHHFAFRVDDVSQALKTVEAHGVRLPRPCNNGPMVTGRYTCMTRTGTLSSWFPNSRAFGLLATSGVAIKRAGEAEILLLPGRSGIMSRIFE